jgi:hypothetical protein
MWDCTLSEPRLVWRYYLRLWDWDSNCGEGICSDEGYQEKELHGRRRMKVENLE